VNEILRDAAERFRLNGIESPRAEARMLWEHAQGRDSIFDQLVQRRLAHEPIAYITGRKEFWSLEFEVGPGVLIPRPETETLVEQTLAELPDRAAAHRILDLGTGTACLLVAILTEYPHAIATGVDCSDAALRWARRNVTRHGIDGRCTFVQGDWAAVEGSFDLVLSNPPYVRSADIAALAPDVRDHEPRGALDGGPDGLDAYRAIAPVLKRHLEPGGGSLLEIGAGQHHLVKEIMEAEGLKVPSTAPDLAGIPRCVVVRRA
jgi:release factor glutamine methyltransferase